MGTNCRQRDTDNGRCVNLNVIRLKSSLRTICQSTFSSRPCSLRPDHAGREDRGQNHAGDPAEVIEALPWRAARRCRSCRLVYAYRASRGPTRVLISSGLSARL
jgi:hypothetical protein